MTERARRHLDELLKLSPEEQSVAIDELLASVDARDADDDEDLRVSDEADEDQADVRMAWAAEIRRRVKAGGPYVSSEEFFKAIDAGVAAARTRRRASRG